MAHGETQIQELLGRADLLPYGPESRAVLDEALALALESGNQELEYAVRLRLVADAEMAGDTDAVLSNFAWCAARNDEDPQRFPTQIEGNDLLWFYKWIPATLAANPRFARADVIQALDAMEARYRREGVGVHGVLQARFSEAYRSGHPEEAERWRQALLTTPEDDYSHCEACSRSEQVDYLLGRGQNEEALAFFDEIMSQNLSCGEEPETVMSTVLVPLLRAERLEDAERAHRLAYRLVRNNPALMPSIAKHIEFCAITGNYARALRLLERHLPWLAHDELDAEAHFSTLLSVATALELVDAAGHGGLTVHGSDDRRLIPVLGEHEGPYTVREFAAAARAAAEALGRAFDERDGSEAHHDRLEEGSLRAASTVALPLGETEVPLELGGATEPEATDVAGWIDAAVWAGVAEDEEAVDAAIAHGLLASPTPRERLSLWGLRAAMREDAARAEAVAQRAQAYRELGLREEAQFESEYGTLVAGVLDEADVAALQSLLPRLESFELRARVNLELALFFLSTGDPAQAMGYFLEGAEEADKAGEQELLRRCVIGAAWAVPLDEENGELQTRLLNMAEEAGPRANQIYDVLYLRSVEAVAILGDTERALRLSREATDLVLRHRAGAPLVQICRFRTDLFTELGRHEEAAATLELLSDALVQLGRAPEAGFMIGRGRSLLRAGQVQAALEVLGDATMVARDAEHPNPAEQAAADHWYGEAAEAAEYFGTALEVWERALETGERALAEAPGAETSRAAALEGTQAGRSLVMLSGRAEHADDVQAYGPRVVALARRLRDTEHGLLPLTLQAVGRAMAQVGDEAGLELLQEAEDLGRADGAAWFSADALDARGRALLGLGRVDEALPALLRAADEYGEAGDPQNAALAEYAVARVLSDLERPDEALSVFESALDRVEDTAGDLRNGVAGAYGDLLAAQGRTAEAARVRGLIS
ncbi:hypothetical protein [Galactobacter valiniphilus]|uniref:hypothetical protein n=1 Tax=Galactobacter valiniphilus TaxID=2676122 RepID=UPI003735D4E3